GEGISADVSSWRKSETAPCDLPACGLANQFEVEDVSSVQNLGDLLRKNYGPHPLLRDQLLRFNHSAFNSSYPEVAVDCPNAARNVDVILTATTLFKRGQELGE